MEISQRPGEIVIRSKGFTVRWRGQRVLARVAEAARQGIEETTTAMAETARSTHPWENRTHVLEESVRVHPAEVEPGDEQVRGSWGAGGEHGGWVAPFMEFGTAHSQPYPWVYPSWDAHKHEFGARIAERLRELPPGIM